VGEPLGIEGTAGEVAVSDLQRWDATAAMIRTENKFLSFGIILNIDLTKLDAALLKERLGAPAIGAPACAVNCDSFHAQ
jgi:hypothetical protein